MPILTYAIFKDLIIPVIAVLSGIIGAAITIYIYYRNSNLRRAEWLYSLFEKFYYQSSYAGIRRILDYGNEDGVRRLRSALQGHADESLEEKLVDFLNFFEVIASLWKLRQLSIKEIQMMFEYCIRRIENHDFILEYLQAWGFEGVLELVGEVRRRGETK
jgi:hypothetical protein